MRNRGLEDLMILWSFMYEEGCGGWENRTQVASGGERISSLAVNVYIGPGYAISKLGTSRCGFANITDQNNWCHNNSENTLVLLQYLIPLTLIQFFLQDCLVLLFTVHI